MVGHPILPGIFRQLWESELRMLGNWLSESARRYVFANRRSITPSFQMPAGYHDPTEAPRFVDMKQLREALAPWQCEKCIRAKKNDTAMPAPVRHCATAGRLSPEITSVRSVLLAYGCLIQPAGGRSCDALHSKQSHRGCARKSSKPLNLCIGALKILS